MVKKQESGCIPASSGLVRCRMAVTLHAQGNTLHCMNHHDITLYCDFPLNVKRDGAVICICLSGIYKQFIQIFKISSTPSLILIDPSGDVQQLLYRTVVPETSPSLSENFTRSLVRLLALMKRGAFPRSYLCWQTLWWLHLHVQLHLQYARAIEFEQDSFVRIVT